MASRLLTGLSLFLALASATCADDLRQSTCKFPVAHDDTLKAERDCTELLGRPGLSNAARAEALKVRGAVRAGADRLREAIADYEAALVLAPDDARLHRLRGWAAFEQYDLAKALFHATTSVELDPSRAESFHLLGRVYEKAQQPRLALAAFDKAVSLDREFAFARVDRMTLLLDEQRYADALADADWLLAQKPEFFQKQDGSVVVDEISLDVETAVRLYHARILGRLLRIEEARREFAALWDHRHEPIVLISLAETLYAQPYRPGEPRPLLDESLAVARQAERLAPRMELVQGVLGDILHDQGKLADALAAYDRALDIEPSDARVRWDRALTRRDLAEDAGARADAFQAVAVMLKWDRGFAADLFGRLKAKGYWLQEQVPSTFEPDVEDAVTACLEDEKCCE